MYTPVVIFILLTSLNCSMAAMSCFQRCICIKKIKLVDCAAIQIDEFNPNIKIQDSRVYRSLSLRQNNIKFVNISSLMTILPQLYYIDLRRNPLICQRFRHVPDNILLLTDCPAQTTSSTSSVSSHKVITPSPFLISSALPSSPTYSTSSVEPSPYLTYFSVSSVTVTQSLSSVSSLSPSPSLVSIYSPSYPTTVIHPSTTVNPTTSTYQSHTGFDHIIYIYVFLGCLAIIVGLLLSIYVFRFIYRFRNRVRPVEHFELEMEHVDLDSSSDEEIIYSREQHLSAQRRPLVQTSQV